MLKWTRYKGHIPKKEKETSKYSQTIYTFDIETTSYFVIDGKVHVSDDYLLYEKRERQNSARCLMYIWQLSIDDIVYYGRTWNELKSFLDKIEFYDPNIKHFWIHNLAFEFQFLKSQFSFKEIFARKRRIPITATMTDYNIEMHCTYFLSNVKLADLPKIYKLDVKKMVGDLEYNKIRTPLTKLTKKELKYCENDCLVLYHYIKKELETYKLVEKIPLTNTGKVRRELKERVMNNKNYITKVRKLITDDPKIYDTSIFTFQGGYTHANYLYTSHVVKDVDSYDFTSSYPYCLTTHLYPMTPFKKCNIKKFSDMHPTFAYMIHIKFYKIKSKYYNNIISKSKCVKCIKPKVDNGRIISADMIETYLTDIDLNLIRTAYEFESYEIIESYYSKYGYLPKELIEFILEKYVIKTEYKGVEEKYLEYMIEKGKFNAIYGMCVTSVIDDEVLYDDNLDWTIKELNNSDIIEKLKENKKRGFLMFEWGVWTTSHGRNNLLRCLLKLDDYVIYADTDSLKLSPGYDKRIIDYYNSYVKKKVEKASIDLKIPIYKYAPKDIKGKSHMLGLFENENDSDYNHCYKEFITQGAKKYAYLSRDYNKEKGVFEDKFHITVAGVPKEKGALCIKKSLSEFKDDLVFDYKTVGKKLICYVDDEEERDIIDYQGNLYHASDKTGISVLPNEYTLSKSDEYVQLLSDSVERRALYKF